MSSPCSDSEGTWDFVSFDPNENWDDCPEYEEYFDGEIKCCVWKENGKRHHLTLPAYTEFYPSGKKKLEMWFKHGYLHRKTPAVFNRFDQQRSDKKLHNDRSPHCVIFAALTEYDDNGVKRLEQCYENNELHNLTSYAHVEYDKDGIATKADWYFFGELLPPRQFYLFSNKFRQWDCQSCASCNLAEKWQYAIITVFFDESTGRPIILEYQKRKANPKNCPTLIWYHRKSGPSRISFYPSGEIHVCEWSEIPVDDSGHYCQDWNPEIMRLRSNGDPSRVNYETGEVQFKSWDARSDAYGRVIAPCRIEHYDKEGNLL